MFQLIYLLDTQIYIYDLNLSLYFHENWLRGSNKHVATSSLCKNKYVSIKTMIESAIISSQKGQVFVKNALTLNPLQTIYFKPMHGASTLSASASGFSDNSANELLEMCPSGLDAEIHRPFKLVVIHSSHRSYRCMKIKQLFQTILSDNNTERNFR